MAHEPPEAPDWKQVPEPRIVYRFVKQNDMTADDFIDCFRPDGERGKTAELGEHPELLTGMSAFTSEDKARKRWAELRALALKKRSERNKRRERKLRMSVGDYIAEVVLGPEDGIEIVDADEPDGHLTIRGPKDRLAARVADVYPAASKPT